MLNAHFFNRLEGMTQELGKVIALNGKLDFSKYPIGSILKILPHHVRTIHHLFLKPKSILAICIIEIDQTFKRIL